MLAAGLFLAAGAQDCPAAAHLDTGIRLSRTEPHCAVVMTRTDAGLQPVFPSPDGDPARLARVGAAEICPCPHDVWRVHDVRRLEGCAAGTAGQRLLRFDHGGITPLRAKPPFPCRVTPL